MSASGLGVSGGGADGSASDCVAFCGEKDKMERSEVRSGVMVFATLSSSAAIAVFIPASVRTSGPAGAVSFFVGMDEVLPMRVSDEPGLSLYADTVSWIRVYHYMDNQDVRGALLSLRTAPPCTSLNCVCGTEVRSSRMAFSAPRLVDGSGNGIVILRVLD